MKDKFQNKDGTCTRYAFACGYMEQMVSENKILQLYQDGLYHVRAIERGNPRWESFVNLTEARAFYRRMRRELFPWLYYIKE